MTSRGGAEGLDVAIRDVLEYDRDHPASGGLRTRLDTLFNRWNEAARAARSEPLIRATAKGTAIDVDEWDRPLYVRSEPGAEGLDVDAWGRAMHKRAQHSNKYGGGRCRCWGEARKIAALAVTEPKP